MPTQVTCQRCKPGDWEQKQQLGFVPRLTFVNARRVHGTHIPIAGLALAACSLFREWDALSRSRETLRVLAAASSRDKAVPLFSNRVRKLFLLP